MQRPASALLLFALGATLVSGCFHAHPDFSGIPVIEKDFEAEFAHHMTTEMKILVPQADCRLINDYQGVYDMVYGARVAPSGKILDICPRLLQNKHKQLHATFKEKHPEVIAPSIREAHDAHVAYDKHPSTETAVGLCYAYARMIMLENQMAKKMCLQKVHELHCELTAEDCGIPHQLSKASVAAAMSESSSHHNHHHHHTHHRFAATTPEDEKKKKDKNKKHKPKPGTPAGHPATGNGTVLTQGKTPLGGVYQQAKDVASKVTNTPAIPGVGNAAGNVGGLVQGIGGAVNNAVNTVKNAVGGGGFGNIVNTVKNAVGGGGGGGIFGGGGIGNVVNTVKNAVGGGGIGSAVSGVVNAFSSIFTELESVPEINTVMKQLVDKCLEL